MEYEFLDEENKKQIVDTQLTELEARHFSLMMAQPSQLTDPQQYNAWSQQKSVLEQTLINLRAKRNQLLAETDFYALSDVTMSSDMTTYRQSLRDLPANNNKASWNGTTLSNVTFPTKPTE